MTAVRPAVESVVTVEHDGNVTFVRWHAAPPRPPVRSEPLVVGGRGKRLPTTRPIPAHLSPRPLRALRRCWRRSQLRRDLIERGWLIGLLLAALLCVAVFPDQITSAAYALLGGH